MFAIDQPRVDLRPMSTEEHGGAAKTPKTIPGRTPGLPRAGLACDLGAQPYIQCLISALGSQTQDARTQAIELSNWPGLPYQNEFYPCIAGPQSVEMKEHLATHGLIFEPNPQKLNF